MMNQLAEVAATANDMVSLTALTAFVSGIGGLILTWVKRKDLRDQGAKEQEQRTVTITGQPLIVQLREEFATRRELEKLEATMTGHVSEMKATSNLAAARMESLFEKTMTAMQGQNTSLTNKIERQNKSLTEEIGKVASGAYQGRQRIHHTMQEQAERIHDQHKDHGERIAKIEAATDVAKQLGKLAESINPPVKVQPTHSNHP